MILTGREIVCQRERGTLTIEPFTEAQLNPNSYNYRLGPTLRMHRQAVLDTHADHDVEEVTIPAGGMVLRPGRIYLGTTVETIGSRVFVPSLIGRSSLGRLGMFLQFSADLGNLGACHRWTLEIKVVQPIRIYPGMVAGQVTFWASVGAVPPYEGHFGRISEATVGPAGLLASAYQPSATPVLTNGRLL
ncbi:dCTP deaminase [Nonomuraea aridisoli]|uniref:Deoxycytidine deaminase n=1 Tax=Nonomuraea aridisoli TaxID=2070368 RepID=A0A2W2EIN3_9ACTN|nr:deoxycytidine deaminase [Nonomuraea aridisoli]PZG09157.1 deoxycytidine deaminase [Nonomuraea aridisoli]